MKYVFFIFLLANLYGEAQVFRVKGPNIFTTSSQVFSVTNSQVKKIVSPFLVTGRQIKVTYINGETRVVNKSELWGIADKNGRVFRYVNGVPKLIRAFENGIVVYGQTGRFSSASFSVGLDGDLFPCNMRALKQNVDSLAYVRLQTEHPKFVNKYFKFF